VTEKEGVAPKKRYVVWPPIKLITLKVITNMPKLIANMSIVGIYVYMF